MTTLISHITNYSIPFHSIYFYNIANACYGRGRKDSQETEEEEEVVSSKWTLRKQAALVLDNLAVTFSAALVLPHALSAIQIKLQTGDSVSDVSTLHTYETLTLGVVDVTKNWV